MDGSSPTSPGPASARPERRLNALTGEFVLVSPRRTARPWLGQAEAVVHEERAPYDPGCYLCPGNVRASGARNPAYQGTFVFDNDFAALAPDAPASPAGPTSPGASSLLHAEPVRGTCRVLCFHPRHDLSLGRISLGERRAVIDTWASESQALGQDYRWVQIFENRGALMGASNPHPHGQIWATDYVPVEPSKEDARQRRYLAEHGRPLLLDYLELERARAERVVLESEYFLALVPYWAVWPFEVLLAPRRHVARLPDLDDRERDDLARILGQLIGGYDQIFSAPFAYSMGWHGAPWPGSGPKPGPGLDAGAIAHWQVHAHFFPPLLRSATVRKFMVGFEMLAEAQRDITAEAAAARLRQAIAEHAALSSAPEGA